MNGKLKETTIPIALLAACGVVSVIYSYFLLFTDRGIPANDPFNILFNVAWLAVLVWIALEIYRRNNIEKTLLFLAFLVSAFTVFDYFDESTTVNLFTISALEASLLFLAYYFLVKDKSRKK